MIKRNKNVNLADALDYVLKVNDSEFKVLIFLTVNWKLQIFTILNHIRSVMLLIYVDT